MLIEGDNAGVVDILNGQQAASGESEMVMAESMNLLAEAAITGVVTHPH